MPLSKLPPQVSDVMKLAAGLPQLPEPKISLSFSGLFWPWLLCGGITILPFAFILAASIPDSSSHPASIGAFMEDSWSLLGNSLKNIFQRTDFFGISIAFSSAYICEACRYLKRDSYIISTFVINIIFCVLFSFVMIQKFNSQEILYYFNIIGLFGVIFIDLFGSYLITKRA